MKKRIAIIGVLITILLMAVVSASLVSYLSNMVTGTVEVKGPVFYLDGSQPIPGYWGLAINEEGISHDPVCFIGPNSIFFISEQLGIESFYEANWDIAITTRTENNVSGKIEIMLWTIEGEDPHLTKEPICKYGPVSIDIPQRDDNKYYSYQVTCPGNELSMDETDRLVLQLSDGFNDIRYYIKLNGNSKIEVSAT